MSPHDFFPKRGEVIMVDFEPVRGHEQGGHRPALVLSADDYNRIVGLAVVVPITSQAKDYPFEVRIPQGHKVKGVVLVDHVKSIDWRKRNARPFDVLSAQLMEEVEERLGPLILP
ncbi:MAG: type II toxin-antitoxin system PemK/MazF family toxin [Thermodesulfobacteriota bacterium]